MLPTKTSKSSGKYAAYGVGTLKKVRVQGARGAQQSLKAMSGLAFSMERVDDRAMRGYISFFCEEI